MATLPGSVDTSTTGGAAASPSRRGRKAGGSQASLHERLQKKLVELEKAREQAKFLEREAKQRIDRIVGAALLDVAARNSEFKALLATGLKKARLSTRDRAEIAHLLVEE